MTIICYPRCSTCRKAEAYLNEREISYTYRDIKEDRPTAMELARYIELNHFRVVCGYQDAYMCTFGGLNYMDFRGKQFYREAAEELYATIEPLDHFVPLLPFVLAHTGVEHSSDAVHKPLRERWYFSDGDFAWLAGQIQPSSLPQ